MAPNPSASRLHGLEDILAGALSRGLRLLPEPAALALGWGLGWFAGSVLRIRRRVVDRNLAIAFPHRSARWRRRVARRVLPHVVREGVTLLRMASLPAEEVVRRTQVEGFGSLKEVMEEGRGLIILTGHLGNWEIGGSSLAARGVPLDVVARRQKNPRFDRRIRESREALGMSVIYREEAPRRVLRSLRKGRAVAIVADQNVKGGGGIFVDFFGRRASTARGPAVFALRTGAPVVLGVAVRVPGWRARYRVRIHSLEVPDSGDPEEDVRTLIRRYLDALENAIRGAPEQYFWLHRRWKTRPPDEAW